MTEILPSGALLAITHQAKQRYAEQLSGEVQRPWWTAVIITASSTRQAARYQEEIERRRLRGTLPAGVTYLVVPDLADMRIGSCGATLNALRVLGEQCLPAGVTDLEAWWHTQRVLIIHSGGDSRRLPQYSLSGKLFSVLPVKTPWGEVSTIFDEMLALSTLWVERCPDGLVVTSGDVLLTLDTDALYLERPGVSGVAVLAPVDVGSRHGVYIADPQGQVYGFLQKPTAAQVRDAGGIYPGDQVALDTGLLRFDAPISARLMTLGGVHDAAHIDHGLLASDGTNVPIIDLYEHLTRALTGEWTPGAQDPPAWQVLATALHGVPFWCALVTGDFTHIGTTTLFRKLLTEETDFLNLYEAQQRLGVVTPPGIRSAGVIIDSVLTGGGELGAGALAIDCALTAPVHAARGAILHGLHGLSGTVEVPEDQVVHQVPIALPDGTRGTIFRVYGVEDDPKGSVEEGTATWFGRPLLDMLALLDITPEQVWPELPRAQWSLWNAELFPLDTLDNAWACARWMMQDAPTYSATRWARTKRLSLASSARYVDGQALSDARTLRAHAGWQYTALNLALAGSDIRPLLAMPPSIAALVATGRSLTTQAHVTAVANFTEAASQYYHAGMFLGQAGLTEDAEDAQEHAFGCVQRAVDAGVMHCARPAGPLVWQHEKIRVSAPVRIDFGGGWSDTPPFCLDWGGAVLNSAITLDRRYPISTTIRRLHEPVLRCIIGDSGAVTEFRQAEELFVPPAPGSPFTIFRTVARLLGLAREDQTLAEVLRHAGGGLEIRTLADLPMGSGLGTSSILAATLLQALSAIGGHPLASPVLIDQVMRVEQLMTTGGGWQDQVGGIVPDVKLIRSGPGVCQHLRIEPLQWSLDRRQDFSARFVLYHTGIQRIAKNLLRQVVGRYLAREVAAVQVLHSIKTLADEMAYAMREGEWRYLGELLDRHWQLNQILDPHTTNAPINALLAEVRPYLAGAKLAGAGGGGFIMMLAHDPEAAVHLRAYLTGHGHAGRIYDATIAEEGLQVHIGP